MIRLSCLALMCLPGLTFIKPTFSLFVLLPECGPPSFGITNDGSRLHHGYRQWQDKSESPTKDFISHKLDISLTEFSGIMSPY
ncbi:hypothetical protein YPC_3228 [Yersinia pestis biovar Medievalis str. Harbin 35]|uniref:Uncharacterized protein n=3 Tax=Yersinia pseudotuberculosis complex TaxID=1649845 RepID=Q8CLJ4_YERPE|nr:hypothetical [Yersinia pestis KIM10+]ABP40984.1 conserved hypothetical protein [Yersinia pestis Pestoides F]ADV99730.1 hypothetical protein YPC_3228 [Yersinia pestis biovar Medievalis str. Harbin 35]EEO77549.1 hypothetical protein YP516_1226 [Yersinia pestis Nepal516]EEO80322.1 hypothetical protein YPF_3138 [Yersinia pestis biovar Orientalis str. India 195]EEO84599.1 hypothetical protein YPH_0418 [Yersinia pestis biovar Orientalis str. PEXU2]EEO88927.1 hypothetical protein YPS_3784 [Yersin